MIGDRVEDVLAAKVAGIPSIGIASSGHSFEQLNDEGANKVFNSMGDFLKGLHSSDNARCFFSLA